MASIQKTAKGWRAQLFVKGERDSATFKTKVEAEVWATRRRTEILAIRSGRGGEVTTLRQAIERYREEVTPTKRGERWESLRLSSWLNSKDHKALPLDTPIAQVTPEQIAAWKDARMAQRLGANTVLRELGLLSGIFTTARIEWRWIDKNPVSDIRKPRTPDHRERIITQAEIDAVCGELGYSQGSPIRTTSQAVALGFLLALESGMRCGEVFGLKWADVTDTYMAVSSKTQAGRRKVPITPTAKQLLEQAKSFDSVMVLGVPVRSVDTLFRRARDRAKLEGFRFHDARHTAATRIAHKLDPLTLCKVMGWSDPRQAMVYFNPTPEQIAARLV